MDVSIKSLSADCQSHSCTSSPSIRNNSKAQSATHQRHARLDGLVHHAQDAGAQGHLAGLDRVHEELRLEQVQLLDQRLARLLALVAGRIIVLYTEGCEKKVGWVGSDDEKSFECAFPKEIRPSTDRSLKATKAAT